MRENIAAIRVDTYTNDKETHGVAVIIPVGEVVELDDKVARFSMGLTGIKWNGIVHAVFPEDLRQRAKAMQLRVDGSGN